MADDAPEHGDRNGPTGRGKRVRLAAPALEPPAPLPKQQRPARPPQQRPPTIRNAKGENTPIKVRMIDPEPTPAPAPIKPRGPSTLLHVGPAPPATGGTTKPSASESSGARPTPVRIEDSGPLPDLGERRSRPTWVAAVLAGRTPKSAPVQLVPGEPVPSTRYRLVRWLGDGGMGVVYEAEHMDIERRVALKVLRPELCQAPEVVKLFRHEARSASKAGADNIVELYDFAELPDGRLMFTMELLSGPTLAAEIGPNAFDVSRAIAILRQMCKGLSAAHEAGIVHRDIKPDNIVLERRRGRSDFVKILDFGISAILTGDEAPEESNAGTPHYLAPEFIAGKSFDARADIYALGCTAYEMLVGHPPFWRPGPEDVPDVLERHLRDVPTPPSKVRRDGTITPALDRVVMRCLAKNPASRYTNMAEVEAALCEAQIEGGLQTSWDDLRLPEVDPELRDKLLRDMPDPGNSMVDGRRSRWPAVAIAAIGLAAGLVLGYLFLRPDDVSEAQQQHVTTLVDEARGAAGSSYFFYPPSDDPKQATAYSKIIELESLSEPLKAMGREHAGELRAEFAQTLVDLGDAYWSRDGGKAFAIDYYAQAVVFDPTNEQARRRAAMTPGQLATLEERARKKEFSPEELEAAEPLAALASEETKVSDEKLAEMAPPPIRRRRANRSGIKRLLGKQTPAPPVPKPTSDAPAPPDEEEAPEPAPPAPDTSVPKVEAGPEAGKDAREGAADLAKRGREAMSAGKPDEARILFERALTYNGRNVDALGGLADINARKGRLKKAIRYAERLVAIAPSSAANRVRLGDIYAKAKRYASARKQYTRAVELGHKSAQVKLAGLPGPDDAAAP